MCWQGIDIICVTYSSRYLLVLIYQIKTPVTSATTWRIESVWLEYLIAKLEGAVAVKVMTTISSSKFLNGIGIQING